MNDKVISRESFGYSVIFRFSEIQIGCSSFSWDEIESMLEAIEKKQSHPLIIEIGYRLIHHAKGVFPLNYVSMFKESYLGAKKIKEVA